MSAALPAEPGLTAAGLAQTWAAAASQTTYLPMSGDELEQFLTRLLNRLVTAVAAVPVDQRSVTEVAIELVARGLTGPGGISCSIEVLDKGLPRLAELEHVNGCDIAVSRVLTTLADGYAQALRQRTFDEQEQVTQALLQAKLGIERELWSSEARFWQVFSESPVGIAISDVEGIVVTANRAFARIVGRTVDDLVGVALPELLSCADESALGEAYHKLASGELTRFRCQGQLCAASGEVAWVFLAGFLLRNPEGMVTHHVITTEDITELNLLQQELARQALHDRLTGLANEYHFMLHLKDVLDATDPSAVITVCRVNLDNFSVINDGIGLNAGEFLLCSVAERLQELVVDEQAMVARMGIDDFAILIEEDAQRDLSQFAAAINTRLSEPVYFGKQGIAVSVGIGLARRRAGATSADQLVRAANITLHRAKRVGGGQWGLYDMDYDIRQRQRCQLTAEIPGAWENGEIDIWYRPLCRLDDGQIAALTAVLRWERADGSVAGHSECLELAEQTGLVVTLGQWIMENACGGYVQTSHYRQNKPPPLRVDLTAQLSQDPDLVGVVQAALAATRLGAEQLWLGVPLPALARGHGDVVDNVHTLADLGTRMVLIGVSADYGFLPYLEDLPLSAVEIAPDIVSRIARWSDNDSLVARAVREVISLTHSADVIVIVPGLDTPEQARWWRSAGAHVAWGTYCGPPVPDLGSP